MQSTVWIVRHIHPMREIPETYFYIRSSVRPRIIDLSNYLISVGDYYDSLSEYFSIAEVSLDAEIPDDVYEMKIGE